MNKNLSYDPEDLSELLAAITDTLRSEGGRVKTQITHGIKNPIEQDERGLDPDFVDEMRRRYIEDAPIDPVFAEEMRRRAIELNK